MYGLLLALIYLAFISLGLPDSLLGAGWADMYVQFDVHISYMGVIGMVVSGCTIISSLFADRFTKRYGTNVITVISVLLTVIALFGFSYSTKTWMLIAFSVPFGLGAGAIDSALNNYVALHYKASHMSWLHCFWGIGAIISPFIMGYALTNTNWAGGYRIVGIIQLIIAIILFLTMPVWKINEEKTEEKQKSIGIIKALKIKGVPYLLIGFFAYCAAEATAMYWASTYFVNVKSISVEQAANFASLFYIGITFGRFLCGIITNKLGDRKMILIGTCVLSVGILGLFLPIENYLVAFISFLVIGFGCAPIYPCVIHSTPNNFGESNSGAIIGIQMASAYVGTTFIPPIFGILGQYFGFQIMPIFLMVFILLMIIMLEITFKITKKDSQTEI